MSAPVFPAAKKGDRVSHNPRSSERSCDVLVAAALGQSLTVRGSGGALLAQVGASASCSSARAGLSIDELLPGSTSGTIEGASPTVFVAPGMGAALAEADPVDCHNHRDKPIAPGTTTVLVQGLGLARTGGETGCGAVICDGAPTVLAGGPAGAGAGAGTKAGSPIADAIAHAEAVAGHLGAAMAAVERGAALIERTPAETAARVESAVSGALSAIAGAFAGATGGASLGALSGAALTSG